jgi:hypothetical protein
MHLGASVAFLLLSIAALFAGPALVALFGRAKTIIDALDGFVLITIGGIVLIDLLPHAIHEAGWWAVGVAVLGLLAPMVSERRMVRADGALLWIALAGLVVHALTDGAALVDHGHAHGTDQHASHLSLALGVVLHRLPLGLFLWFAVRPAAGAKGALGIVTLVAAATAGGFFGGEAAFTGAPHYALALFQAFVSGSLLHVVLHHAVPSPADQACEVPHGHHHPHLPEGEPHDHHHEHHHHHEPTPYTLPSTLQWSASVGALLGVWLLVGLAETHAEEHADGLHAGDAFIRLALEASPLFLAALLVTPLLIRQLDLGTLVDRIMPWILVLLAVAAFIEPTLSGGLPHPPPSLTLPWLQWASLAGMALILGATLVRQGPRGLINRVTSVLHRHRHHSH